MKKQNKLSEKFAVDRTNLAIDRTLLAYLRTSLTIIVVGISFIKIFDGPVLSILGWLSIIFSLVLLVYGGYKCRRIKKQYKTLTSNC